jgi:hypothetical protein
MLQGLGWVINSNHVFPEGSDALLGREASAWGWWQILIGAVVLLAGIAVFSGNVLARTLGVIVDHDAFEHPVELLGVDPEFSVAYADQTSVTTGRC